MGQGHIAANSRLLQNLHTYINEEQVFNAISRLTREVEKIELFSGRSLRTIKMRNEIARLQVKLDYCKDQASFRTEQYHKIKSDD